MMTIKNRIWCSGLVALGLMVGAAERADAAQILVYDDNTTNQRAQAAVTSLGHTLTVGNASNFNTLLGGGPWDAVVVDAPSTFPSWAPLINYIAGGGKVIMSFWTLQTEAALAAAFQVSVASSFSNPLPVYRWDASHPIFNSPNAVGDLINFTNQWADDGDKLNLVALSGATAVAGFSVAPAVGEGAIVIGNDGRTIYNGFLFDEATDSIPLIANQIEFLLSGGVTPIPEPSTLAMGATAVALAGLGAWRRRRRTPQTV